MKRIASLERLQIFSGFVIKTTRGYKQGLKGC